MYLRGAYITSRMLRTVARMPLNSFIWENAIEDGVPRDPFEFQRLNGCPGEPLSIIRSALTEAESGGTISLLLTGSLREKLELMLHTDTEPIWDQTHVVEGSGSQWRIVDPLFAEWLRRNDPLAIDSPDWRDE